MDTTKHPRGATRMGKSSKAVENTIESRRGLQMAHVVNPLTGEIVELDKATDDELISNIKDMEEMAEAISLALRGCKMAISERMTKEGAKLKISPWGKVRIRYSARVADKRLVEALYSECPEQMKKACFAFDIRPLKTGLNELAKLGAAWQSKVVALYENVPSLVFEWAVEEKQVNESIAVGDDIVLF
jgi:hypothetical protein